MSIIRLSMKTWLRCYCDGFYTQSYVMILIFSCRPWRWPLLGGCLPIILPHTKSVYQSVWLLLFIHYSANTTQIINSYCNISIQCCCKKKGTITCYEKRMNLTNVKFSSHNIDDFNVWGILNFILKISHISLNTMPLKIKGSF